MPEVSRFFGIVIRMYFDDHEPPHHALYGGAEAQVRITPVGLIAGQLPPRALALVVEWARLHEGELLQNWRRLRGDEPPTRIAPLE